MEQATFDRERADQLIQEIGAEIVRGSEYAERPWEKIVLVGDFAQRKRMFGYVYWDGDRWEAAGPDGFTALRLMQDLQQATAVDGQESWKRCLVRIDRATGKIDVEFDKSGERWEPDLSDPAGFALGLR